MEFEHKRFQRCRMIFKQIVKCLCQTSSASRTEDIAVIIADSSVELVVGESSVFSAGRSEELFAECYTCHSDYVDSSQCYQTLRLNRVDDIDLIAHATRPQGVEFLSGTDGPSAFQRVMEGACGSDPLHGQHVQSASSVLVRPAFGESRVNKFISSLYDFVQIKLSRAELVDIRMSVEEMIGHILSRVKDKDSRLVCTELIKTGSSYDDTKLFSPDEFDFLAVMGRLSNDVCASVERVCRDNLGFAHVRIKDGALLGWEDLLSDGGVLKAKALRERFRYVCHDVVHERRLAVENNCIEKNTGSLVLDGYAVSINGPQFNVLLKWTSRDDVNRKPLFISVDVCPTIKCRDVTSVLHVEHTANEQVYDAIEKAGYSLLIPRPQKACEFCFKLVFAEADRTLVKTLDSPHRTCLVVLKYIGNLCTTHDVFLKKTFNPFALKMATLHHSFSCNSEKGSNVGSCMLGMLEALRSGLNMVPPRMPSVFVNEHNVWRNLVGETSAVYDQQSIALSTKLLTDLIAFFQSIDTEGDSDYDFDSLHSRLIRTCQRKYPSNTKRTLSMSEVK